MGWRLFDYPKVDQGLDQLGPIMDLTSCFDRYKPTEPSADLWKERGGEYNDALYNLGSHMIDQAIVLFGKPTRIFCRSWPQRGVEGLDEAVSTVD
jgi:scyllo-inositol 2-dehydrogenase (NADP+)